MRRTVIVVAVVASLAAPAQAHQPPLGARQSTEHTFPFGAPPDGALPCSVVCAYWLDNGFTPCENPFPPGSYIERLTPPAGPSPEPGKIAVLEISFDVMIEWDMFLCTWPGRSELPKGMVILGSPCDNALGPNNVVPIGCHEDHSTPVAAGAQWLMIAYNWADAFDAHAKSWIVHI